MKRKLKGDGIIDWAKNAYRVIRNPTQSLTQMPKQVSDTLKRYGDSTVREIVVGRTKVLKVVQGCLDGLSLKPAWESDTNKELLYPISLLMLYLEK